LALFPPAAAPAFSFSTQQAARIKLHWQFAFFTRDLRGEKIKGDSSLI